MPPGAVQPMEETVGDSSGKEALALAWRVAVCATVATGILHLFNLIESDRVNLGPVMLTPFRAAFAAAWLLVILKLSVRRRLPRLVRADGLVAVIAAVYLARAFFQPATLSVSLNWLMTAAGVYFLLRLGISSRKDVRAIFFTVAASVLAISIFGLAEYAFKDNPLFDRITVEAIGVDARVQASGQFYRIRSLAGHPGFAAAILLAGVPVVYGGFRRRRSLQVLSLLLMALALFLTFSRGSWLIALLLLAVLAYGKRAWIIRNYKWLLAPAVLAAVVLAIDSRGQTSAFIDLKPPVASSGMTWSEGMDGPASFSDQGLSPDHSFVYFDVDNGFAGGSPELVSVVIYFLDDGDGAVRVEYRSTDSERGDPASVMRTPNINKTDSGKLSTAVFEMRNPAFDGRLNQYLDFRLVDEDNRMVLQRVELYDGKLKLPQMIRQHWLSRSSSFSTRLDLFPFAWGVFMDHKWGVGTFNSPGTGNHAVDSWPLTWLMEFGWVSFPLMLLLAGVVIREAWAARRSGDFRAAVLLAPILILLLHGGHLMILYDKPSIVMLSTLTALYATVRPGGSALKIEENDLVL